MRRTERNRRDKIIIALLRIGHSVLSRSLFIKFIGQGQTHVKVEKLNEAAIPCLWCL